jgi:hypothetical protein
MPVMTAKDTAFIKTQSTAALVSMYSTCPTCTGHAPVIEQFYHAKATFTDPLVQVQGHDHIRLQFDSLKGLFSEIIPTVHSISISEMTTAIDREYGTEQSILVVIDCTVNFRLRTLFFPLVLWKRNIPLRSIVRLKWIRLSDSDRGTTEDGWKVVEHEDMWSFVEALRALLIPDGLEFLDEIRRRIVGKVTSNIIRLLGV